MIRNLNDSKDTGKLVTELSHLAHTYVSAYRPTTADLKKHGILKNLRKNKDIVILQPDKGNGVVVLDRTKYDRSILKIIWTCLTDFFFKLCQELRYNMQINIWL